jgi:branched-chain amino acid transport system ATP-binding protein
MTPILQIQSLDKSFGGLHVTDNVSFAGDARGNFGHHRAQRRGQDHPFQPDHREPARRQRAGVVQNQDILGSSPQQIVARGIGRAFQIASIFPDETVLDNIRIACLSKRNETVKYLRPVEDFTEATEDAHAILQSLGLDNQANRLAFELAHGDQKLLDIGIALALRPTLLLLDEPTAGMSPEERLHTKELIMKLWKAFDLTLVFIEHDMDMVFGIAQTVRVLQQGALLAEGTPEEIRANKEVITAYLGEEF